MNGRDIHVVTAQEAVCLERRAQALRRFTRRYNHTPEGQRAMVGALHRLATTFSQGLYNETTFPWEYLYDADQSQAMWDAVASSGSYSRATVVRDASALRIMIARCADVGLLSYEQAQLARAFETKGGGTVRPPAGHYLENKELETIIRATESGTGTAITRTRDVALILALASSGARRDELAYAKVEDLDQVSGRLWLGRCKGRKTRDSYLHPIALEAVRSWLDVRGPKPGALFPPMSRSRALVHRGHMGGHQIWKVVTERAANAGIPGITPHDLRRFLISHLLETQDLTLVARIVGHESTTTTAKYDRRPARFARAAIETLELPNLKTPR